MATILDLTSQKPFRERIISDEELELEMSLLLDRCYAGAVNDSKGTERLLNVVARTIARRVDRIRPGPNTISQGRWDWVRKLIGWAADIASDIDCNGK
jgi:hypothetical protein